MTGYWLEDIGIDGFRVDAAKHLIEEGDKLENTDATHEWFKGFYTFYKDTNPNTYTVGEIYGAGAFLATKYTEQLDHIFNFDVASGIVNSTNGELNTGINSAWTFTLKDIPNGDYATFLTNHDQNRVMSVLNGKVEKAKLAAVMLLTSPGTPFIYYGEEIGMQGKKPDEDIRLPMQWSADVNCRLHHRHTLARARYELRASQCSRSGKRPGLAAESLSNTDKTSRRTFRVADRQYYHP